jgi:ABC-type transporter Mla maintaining outer membrane lipid asymmetry ATPase subunit MlaF
MADKVEFVDVRKQGLFEGLSFAAPTGAITALVGPPGAGPMVIRMVAGLERPTKGVVLVSGVDVGAARGSRLRRIRRGMAVMHGESLYERSTVRENVTHPMRVAGHIARRHVDAIALEYLMAFDLTGVSEEKPPALTAAERHRLAACKTLALRAPLVLLDGLDPFLYDVVRAECRRRHVSCLLTAPDPATAGRIADRTVDLGSGDVLADEVDDVAEHLV